MVKTTNTESIFLIIENTWLLIVSLLSMAETIKEENQGIGIHKVSLKAVSSGVYSTKTFIAFIKAHKAFKVIQ